MEGDQGEVARVRFVGKRTARAPSPIRTGHRDEACGGRETRAGEDAGKDRQGDVGEGSHVAVQGEKKKNLLSSQPDTRQRQAPGSIHMVTGVGPASTFVNQETQPLDVESNISVLDGVSGRTTEEVEEATAGVAS